jgi:hypothetical protein
VKYRMKFPLPKVGYHTLEWDIATTLNWFMVSHTVRRLPLKKLVGTQSSVLIRGVKNVNWKRPVFVIRINGVYYIRDGHHRVTRAFLKGQKTIRVQLTEAPCPKQSR